MRRFSGFKAVKSTVSILFLLGLCLSCVRADDEATFVVLQHYLNPTCTSNSDPNGGIPVAIYQNGFCYKGPPGEDAYSYKFDSTTFQTFSGTSCEGLPSRSEEIKNGDCMQADNSNIYNLDHLKLLNTNLAANTFDMTSQDLVSGKCKTAPGGDVYQNKIWDIRRYSKCYAKDGYQTYHTIKFGDGNTYLVGKIFDKPYCKGTYTTNLMPMDSCFPLLEDQSPDSWINIHNNSGALDHFMNVYYDLDASHFPFKNQTFPAPTPPEPMPSDEVSQDKEWVHKKAFKDDQCVNENVAEYEQLYEVGRCYKMSYVNMSEAFLKDDNDELGYYWYNETSDCDASPSVQLPLEADLDISCSPLYKNYTIKMVKPEAIDPDNRGLGVVVVKWPQNSDCDSKDPGYMFSFLPADTCLLDYEDTSFILSQTDAVSMTKVHYKTDGCSGEVDYTVPYHYKTCNPQPDGSSFMAFNPATAANDLLDYFPGSTVEDFPLKGLPPVAAKTWTAITFTTDQGCTQEQGRMIIAENNLCYDIGDSIMLTGTEFKTYQGPGCSEDKLNASIPMNKVTGMQNDFTSYKAESFDAEEYGALAIFFEDSSCSKQGVSHFQGFETDTCLQSGDDRSMLMTANSSGVTVHEYSDSDCTILDGDSGGYFEYKECVVTEEGGAGIMGIHPSAATEDLMDIFGGSASDYPFIPTSPPPPPPPSGSKTWTHLQYLADPMCLQSNEPYGTPDRIFENGFCYADHAGNSFKVTPEKMEYYTGDDCQSQNTKSTHILADGDCFLDEAYGFGHVKIVNSTVDPNTFNVTSDVVGSNYCQYDSESRVHFATLKYYECYHAYGYAKFSPMIEDFKQYLLIRSYSEQENVNCDGGQYVKTRYPFGECHTEADDEYDTWFMTSPSGALDAFMEEFSTTDETLFPFMNQTFPPAPPPVPSPPAEKEWVFVKHFRDENCTDASTEDFEQLLEVGLCYTEEETSHSILYDHGELSFYEWNATNCTGLLREQNPFGSDVNMTCSILNPGMQFKTFGAESLNATQGGALALEFFGDTCEMAPDKYTYHFYDINVCIASDDEEDNYSFILTTNSSGVFSQTFRDLTCHTPTTPEDYAGPHAFLFKNCTPTGDGKSLIAEGKLAALADDLQTSWATTTGLPKDSVIVTLKQGSLITEIELKYEGEDSESDAKFTKQEVENFDMVVNVIKGSDTFMSVLGIDDKSDVDVNKVKSLAEIDGEVHVEEEGTSKAGVSGMMIGVIFGGSGVALLVLVTYGVKRRRNRSQGAADQQWYHDLNQTDSYRFEESPLGSPINGSNRQVQLNPLSL